MKSASLTKTLCRESTELSRLKSTEGWKTNGFQFQPRKFAGMTPIVDGAISGIPASSIVLGV
ncbi:MAG: hypothetical protein EON58_13660 [Alphaproteobacteria bacterium]|nr:MAG: hypothetical protein EON58_13660 [Alphaproteobacteria bacterium]